MLKRMDTNVINLIKVGFDCFSELETNVKDEYECYEFDIFGTNVGFDCLSDLDTWMRMS